MDNNPLKQYFRQPAIYVSLPSQGEFYPEGALDRAPDNQYPVLPMTTMDEITYRTPDALFNGNAVTAVIQSCMPNIRDAWSIPACDLDTILVGIRIASYGHAMTMTTNCPGCQNTSDYELDLRSVMDRMRPPDYSAAMEVGDLELHFEPLTYRAMNESSMAQFREQKTIQVLQDQSVTDEDKVTRLGEMLKTLTAATVRALADSIKIIRTPGAQVSDKDQITEWLSNCDRAVFNRVRDHVMSVKRDSEIQPLQITCSQCQKQYEQPFTLDMSNFFAAAS